MFWHVYFSLPHHLLLCLLGFFLLLFFLFVNVYKKNQIFACKWFDLFQYSFDPALCYTDILFNCVWVNFIAHQMMLPMTHHVIFLKKFSNFLILKNKTNPIPCIVYLWVLTKKSLHTRLKVKTAPVSSASSLNRLACNSCIWLNQGGFIVVASALLLQQKFPGTHFKNSNMHI